MLNQSEKVEKLEKNLDELKDDINDIKSLLTKFLESNEWQIVQSLLIQMQELHMVSILTINTGADFNSTFKILEVDRSDFDLTGYSGSSQMRKSAAVGSTTFPVANIHCWIYKSSEGEFKISLGSTQTRLLKNGRYVYDILVGSASTVYRIVEGNILVQTGVSSAP